MSHPANAIEPSHPPFVDVRVRTWEDALHLFRTIPDFLYRGQADSRWPLESGLHRALARWNAGLSEAQRTEALILREFKRRAHHHVAMPPALHDDTEWLALIQHHGGPTRMLDFTHSPYIAAFFALDSAEAEAAVWAVNRWLLERSALRLFGLPWGVDLSEEFARIAESILSANAKRRGLLWVEPFRLNERMARQQGAFIFPCDAGASFNENLLAAFGDETVGSEPEIESYAPHDKEQSNRVKTAFVTKIRFPRDIQLKAIKDLASMNVTAATLFGGLDGFARSLLQEVRIGAERAELMALLGLSTSNTRAGR